jgi:hypothetical protein
MLATTKMSELFLKISQIKISLHSGAPNSQRPVRKLQYMYRVPTADLAAPPDYSLYKTHLLGTLTIKTI